MQVIEPFMAKDVVHRLVRIQEEIEEGRYYTLKTDEEIEQFFRDLEEECN